MTYDPRVSEVPSDERRGLGRRPAAFTVLLITTLVEAGLWYASFHAPRLSGLTYIPLILFGWMVLLITLLVVGIGEMRASMRERAAIHEGLPVTPATDRGAIAFGLFATLAVNVLIIAIWAK